jgi:hypothetical protein
MIVVFMAYLQKKWFTLEEWEKTGERFPKMFKKNENTPQRAKKASKSVQSIRILPRRVRSVPVIRSPCRI